MKTRSHALLSVLAFLWTLSASFADKPDPPARFDDELLVEVTLDTRAEIDRMLEISGEFWSCVLAPGENLFMVSPDALAELEESGLPFTIVSQDVQELIDAAARANAVRGNTWFENFHPLAEINAFMDALVAARPDLATKITVGTSLEGRTIYGLRLTGPGDSSGRPALLFNSCQHAREWVSPPVPMYVADRLLSGYGVDPYLTLLMDRAVFYLIPVVNVDGYEYSWSTNRLWRKNRRNNGDGTFGVDTNRNWGYEWGGAGASTDPSAQDYRGPSPFSEPETQAMRDFVLAHPEIVGHIDIHSYSQLVMSPWGYSTGEPSGADGQLFRNLNAAMAAAIYAVHGETYVHGPIGATLYLASGNAVDWMYGDRGVFSWTIELRPTGSTPGFLLPPEEILPTCEENYQAILLLAGYTTAPLTFTYPEGLPEVVTPDVPETVRVQISDRLESVQPGSEMLVYRVASGAWESEPLSAQGNDEYIGTLGAAPCGALIEYYFSAQTTTGATVTDPPLAPGEVYGAMPLEISTYAEADMETTAGWTVGAPDDDATTGVWNRMNPQGTAAQPEDDHTPGGVNCWVTDGNAGSGVGSFDVDGGKTTLYSAVYDLSAADDPTASYWRWYSNTAGASPNADVFVVDISVDGVNWVNVETVGPAGPEVSGGWIRHEFRVWDFVAPGSSVQLRFVAADEGDGSIIEAAVDDLLISEATCDGAACPGDLDMDGDRDLADLSVLLSNYGLTGGATAEQGDITGDGNIDLEDLSLLLAVFGEPCVP